MDVKITKCASLALPLLILLHCFLQGCVSSNVAKESAQEIDGAHYLASSFFDNAANSNLASAYQNTSSTTKGIFGGATAGAVVGGLTSGIGVLPGATVGAIWGGGIGAYLSQRMTLVDQVENHGVKVVVLGDQVLLVLPSELLFNGVTPSISTQGYATLDLIAHLIGGYTKMSVKVAAYTSDSLAQNVSRAITKQQAENVLKALWRREVNARLMYAVGYGGTHLVEQDCSDKEGGANYRVEITLEKLPT